MSAAVAVIRTPEQAAALVDPARLRVLETLRTEPNSAAGVARVLSLSRQQVNYHLRDLETQHLVEFVEERRKGNCMERIVRATARSYLISPEALGKLGSSPEARHDRFSIAHLVATAARAIRDLAVLQVRADKAGKRLATLTLDTEITFESPESRNAFAEELANTVAQLTAKYHRPEGRKFRLFAACYPAITKTENDGPEAARME